MNVGYDVVVPHTASMFKLPEYDDDALKSAVFANGTPLVGATFTATGSTWEVTGVEGDKVLLKGTNGPNAGWTNSVTATRKTAYRKVAWTIDDVRSVLTDGYKTVDGMLLDSFTASAITQVYDALSPENQAKIAALPLEKASDVCFKLINKQSSKTAWTGGADWDAIMKSPELQARWAEVLSLASEYLSAMYNSEGIEDGIGSSDVNHTIFGRATSYWDGSHLDVDGLVADFKNDIDGYGYGDTNWRGDYVGARKNADLAPSAETSTCVNCGKTIGKSRASSGADLWVAEGNGGVLCMKPNASTSGGHQPATTASRRTADNGDASQGHGSWCNNCYGVTSTYDDNMCTTCQQKKTGGPVADLRGPKTSRRITASETGYYVVSRTGSILSGPYATFSEGAPHMIAERGATVQFKGPGDDADWALTKAKPFPVGLNTVNGSRKVAREYDPDDGHAFEPDMRNTDPASGQYCAKCDCHWQEHPNKGRTTNPSNNNRYASRKTAEDQAYCRGCGLKEAPTHGSLCWQCKDKRSKGKPIEWRRRDIPKPKNHKSSLEVLGWGNDFHNGEVGLDFDEFPEEPEYIDPSDWLEAFPEDWEGEEPDDIPQRWEASLQDRYADARRITSMRHFATSCDLCGQDHPTDEHPSYDEIQNRGYDVFGEPLAENLGEVGDRIDARNPQVQAPSPLAGQDGLPQVPANLHEANRMYANGEL